MDGINLRDDEEGAVMVEFVIVFPFLGMLMLAILYYIEVTRFQMSALHLAQAQAWRAASLEQTGLARSDEFKFAGEKSSAAASTIHPRSPFLIDEPKDAGHDYISLLTGGGGFDAARTMFLVPPNKAVWEYLSINPTTFNRNALDPANVNVNGLLRYRNQTFTRPLAGVSDSFVGRSNEVSSDGLQISELEFTVTPAIPMLHDPFSIFWGKGEPAGGNIQRLRNVDRYTITSDPIYLAGLSLHGVMTANMRSVGHLTNDLLLRDLYAGANQSVGNNSMGGIMDLFSVVGKALPGGSKHAQPLWKVDKNANTEQHDRDGKVTYGGEEWGKPITERHRLTQFQSSSDRWEMIQ